MLYLSNIKWEASINKYDGSWRWPFGRHQMSSYVRRPPGCPALVLGFVRPGAAAPHRTIVVAPAPAGESGSLRRPHSYYTTTLPFIFKKHFNPHLLPGSRWFSSWFTIILHILPHISFSYDHMTIFMTCFIWFVYSSDRSFLRHDVLLYRYIDIYTADFFRFW